jgi:hypothetical protein
VLLDTEMDGTKVFVEVHISPESGALVMAGQDIGAAPRVKLSMTWTASPRASAASAMCEPMKPPPPVMRSRMGERV